MIKENYYGKNFKKKKLNIIAAGYRYRYGNAIRALSNLIFICEKIRCNKILIQNNIWNIKNPIKIEEYNITIEPTNSLDCFNDLNVICFNDNLSFYFPRIIKKIYHNLSFDLDRRYKIREAIINGTPEYRTDPNDLYIHIRSEDIFKNMIVPVYYQPPLCYYLKIINSFNFNNIYIISNGKENPCINKLLEMYPKIEYIQGNVIHDSTLLFNAYNIVSSKSSFIESIIFFSKKLKRLFSFKYKIGNKNSNYIEYNLNASNEYKKIMIPWRNSSTQYQFYINDKCENTEFSIFYWNKRNESFNNSNS